MEMNIEIEKQFLIQGHAFAVCAAGNLTLKQWQIDTKNQAQATWSNQTPHSIGTDYCRPNFSAQVGLISTVLTDRLFFYCSFCVISN